jgi:lipopolysaccharide/colanic/teichoic acid biosynthesis glycosyltransferase
MVIIAYMIKRDSEGPVFYRQTRIGQYGKPFSMIKFRCMVENADQQWSQMVTSRDGADGRMFKDPNDPRITRVGRYLRRYSLDELPQFFNVLKGDMSVVGPRPPLPEEVEHYEEWHLQRLLVRPGLTGLWQVNGRSNLTFDEMVRLDLYYAENWSPWLDIKIALRTIPAVIFGRGAY